MTDGNTIKKPLIPPKSQVFRGQSTEQDLFEKIDEMFKAALEPIASELVEIRDSLAVMNKNLNEGLLLTEPKKSK